MNLALQGGGALGAFTWGVLHKLCERPELQFKAISGASAGALNAAVFVSGYLNGGTEGAKEHLDAFWNDISSSATQSQLLLAPLNFGGDFNMLGAMFKAGVSMANSALNYNPLRQVIENHVDFDALKYPTAPKLFVSATNVMTADTRIFTNKEMSVDVLLASACLPSIHPTVWIDGAPYWDGGFTSNPPLMPLYNHRSDRTLLVRLIRAGAEEAPKRDADIELYLKRLMFARPLRNDMLRLSENPKQQLPDEINADDHEIEAKLTSSPTRRIVSDLFDKGQHAADAYLHDLSYNLRTSSKRTQTRTIRQKANM